MLVSYAAQVGLPTNICFLIFILQKHVFNECNLFVGRPTIAF
jgi:hypothetical protein